MMNLESKTLKIEPNNEIELQKGVCGSTVITSNGETFDLAVHLTVGDYAILQIDVSPQCKCEWLFEEVHISLCPSGEYNVSVFVNEPIHDVTDHDDALAYLVMRKTVLAGVEYLIHFAHREKEAIVNLLSSFLEMDEQEAIRQIELNAVAEREDYETTSKALKQISIELADHFIQEIQNATDDYDDSNGFRLELVILHHDMRFVERANLYKSGGLYFVGQSSCGKYKTRQIDLDKAIWFIKNTHC
ncbi:hypothetical protein OTK49_20760 [Vibrio coralliirubri]|uniref:hypothetical protein n=1 Tax=Vibrio coralliirubri TaxID=1516159 RepID=UPI002285277F|nr:hypothetical protein [Vibrio coralliirubri]MCY9864950.1 hypothetical protein [Vibrio coralliirubri]